MKRWFQAKWLPRNPICALLEGAGWLIASLYSRVKLGIKLTTRGASLPLAVAGQRGGSVGANAHLLPPCVPMAPVPIPAPHTLPKGSTEMPLWGRGLGVLLPRLKVWSRLALFICTLARPSFLA